MAFDRKAWDAANNEKNKLYSVRYRLRKKGLDLAPETIAELEAMREAKKAASKERERERKRLWSIENRERRNAARRKQYQADPELRERELAKRRLAPEVLAERAAKRNQARAATAAEKERLKQEAKEARKREREEARLKARKEANAKRHMEAVARADKIVPRQVRSSAPPTYKVKKPGRLVALSGWMGW